MALRTPEATSLKSTLETKSRDELNVLAKRLSISGLSRASKADVIDALLRSDRNKLTSTLFPTWWFRYHSHVYGVATIIALIASVAFYLWPAQSDQKINEELESDSTSTNVAKSTDEFPLLSYGINTDGVVLPSLYNRGRKTLHDLDVIVSYTPEWGGPYIIRQSFPFLHPGSNVSCKTFDLSKVEDARAIHSQITTPMSTFFQTTELSRFRSRVSNKTSISGRRTQVYRKRHDSEEQDQIYDATSTLYLDDQTSIEVPWDMTSG
jgi:hypothetical protein